MAADDGGGDTGPLTARYPFLSKPRAPPPAPQGARRSPDGSPDSAFVPGLVGRSAAPYSPTPESPANAPSPTTGSPDGPGAFPPLPPPPSGSVDEGDGLDGPEYEEEEVAFSLTAPPTDQ